MAPKLKKAEALKVDKDQEEAQFTDDPKGWAARWKKEIEAAKKNREAFDREGSETIKRFLDKRDQHDNDGVRVNVYTANVQTQEAMLYGKTPKVDVGRRFSDFEDQGARVAADMLDRLLNTDISRDSDTFASSLKYALSDLLRPGLGVARCRYEVDFDSLDPEPALIDAQPAEDAPDPEGLEVKAPGSEDVKTEYVHWRDFGWTPARTWHDVRAIWFRAYLSREECVSAFGEKVGNKIKVKRGNDADKGASETDAHKADPWARAEVYEIWDKEHRGVWFYSPGSREVFAPEGIEVDSNGMIPDPLGLDGFWPCPEPLAANLTTDSFMPRSDYALVQDLYREVDDLSTRISRLTKAMRVVGVYDKTNQGIQRMVREATETELIAVESWAKFVDKGGVKGAIDWMPLEMIAGALDKLRDMRRETKQIADEISGYSDIVRGEQSPGQTATTSAIEAKFASTRMQRRQDEVARFASDLQRIKAEIICKHFDDQTIIDRSNVLRTPNAKMAQLGIQSLRDDLIAYRIEVKPDSMALTDWGLKQNERTTMIGALGSYLQSSMPLIQLASGAGPGAVQSAIKFVMTTGQWLMAGIRGGGDVETVFNQFITEVQQIAQQAAMQPQQPPPPDPKVEATKIKSQAEIGKAQIGLAQAHVEGQVAIQKAGLDLAKAQHQHAAGIQSEEAKQRAEALRSLNAVTTEGAPA
jgi:hypothetical protein